MSGPESLVSVVVVCRDGERFLAEALDSVLAQTYTAWELLFVDDGSVDGSRGLAEGYARSDARVRVLAHDDGANHGMSASRNLALRHATGELVAFLDADDAWLPRKLEEQVALLRAHPNAVLVFGRTEWWESWRGGDAGDRTPDFLFEADRVYPPPYLLTEVLRAEQPTTTVALVRRWALAHVGRFDDRFAGLYEDQVAFAKLAVAFPLYVSSACWYRWRRHDDSSCIHAVRTGTHAGARRRYLEWLGAYLDRHAVDEPTLRAELRTQLARAARRGQPARAASVVSTARAAAARVLPEPALRAAQRAEARLSGRPLPPPVGKVRFGSLDRPTPVSRTFGSERGTPVDRHFIDHFFGEHASDVRGRVLEVGADVYASRLGGSRVSRVDVVDVLASNEQATFVADLASGDGLPPAAFDCVLVPQTLQMVYDVGAAVATLARVLAPGGVALVTLPGITALADRAWRSEWYWSFTTNAARRLFEASFEPRDVDVRAYGNVLVATAFLQGLALAELPRGALDVNDSEYQVIVAVRAVKGAERPA